VYRAAGGGLQWPVEASGVRLARLGIECTPKPPRRPLLPPSQVGSLFCSALYFAATSGVCLIRSGAAGFSKVTTFAKNKKKLYFRSFLSYMVAPPFCIPMFLSLA
jgi:hypothetical protein